MPTQLNESLYFSLREIQTFAQWVGHKRILKPVLRNTLNEMRVYEIKKSTEYLILSIKDSFFNRSAI